MGFNTPYPIDDGGPSGSSWQPWYYALFTEPHDADPSDPAVVHPNRYSIYYDGDTVYRSLGLTAETAFYTVPTTYTVRALFPAAYGTYQTGDIVKTGAVVLTRTSVNNMRMTLGTAGPANDFPPGAYRVYLTGDLTDTRTILSGPNDDIDCSYGDSYGVSQFLVLREHSSALDIRTLNSTYSTFNWKPNGYGRTDAEVNSGSGFGEDGDMILRAALSMGVGRIQMFGNAPEGNTGPSFSINGGVTGYNQATAVKYANNALNPYWLAPSNTDFLDPVRARYAWLNYVYFFTAYDAVLVANDGSQPSYQHFAAVYPITPSLDPTKLFIKGFQSAGGATINVYYPNAATLVESHPGITPGTIESAINGNSNYIMAFPGGGNQAITMTSPVAVGTNCRSQLTTLAQTLAPLGITRFELPENEPGVSLETAHQFWLAYAALQDAGLTNIKAIGPAPVTVTEYWDSYFDHLLNTAGLTKDQIGLSFHDYNIMIAGNFQQGRNVIEQFMVILKRWGLEGAEMWQTEANHAPAGDHGVYMPWRAAEGFKKMLLWEQYGIPRERNPHWGGGPDAEHAFWAFPTFLEGRGHVAMNVGALYSVLGQETFGQNHHHRVDFGSVIANQMFLGSLYGDPVSGSTLVLCCASEMEDSTVTVNFVGLTNPIPSFRVTDGVGNRAFITPDVNSQMVVNVSSIPTYITIPPGIAANIDSVRDHGSSPNPSVSNCYIATSMGGSPAPTIASGTFMSDYSGLSTAGVAQSSIGPPDTAEIKFNQDFDVDRLVVWCGPPYQSMCSLINYTVDTWDGSTWTTNTTVTKTIPASFRFGDASCYGTILEQLNDGQWIEDVTLDGGPVTCKGVRISVTTTADLTFGGARDALADGILNGWGGSTSTPKITLQRMDVVSGTAFALPSDYGDTVLADSPVAYFKLNEASGSTVSSQVNGLTSSSIANVTFGASSIVPSTGDTSAEMDTRPLITIPNNSVFNLGDTFTLEAWIYGTNSSQFLQNQPDGVGLMDKTSQLSGSWKVNVGRNFSFYTLGGGNTQQLICRSTTQLSPGVPYHLVISKSGSTVHMYVNAQDVTGSITNHTITNNTSVIQLGDAGQSVGYNLSHVAIYPTALSSSIVAAHYLAGVAPNPPANVYAPFIEGVPIANSQIQCSMNTTIDWTNSPTSYSYQWQSSDSINSSTPGISGMYAGFYPGGWYQGGGALGNWTDIDGETNSDLIPTDSLAGKYLRCNVTAFNAAGATAAIPSDAVGPVIDLTLFLTGYWS